MVDTTREEVVNGWAKFLGTETTNHHNEMQLMVAMSQRKRARSIARRTRIAWILLFSTIIFFALLGASKANATQASCYGPGLFGNHMANGQVLNRTTVAVAHKTLPLGTRLRVAYGTTVVTAIVKDRGPFVSGRSLDLTEALVQQLIGYSHSPCRQWGVRSVRTWKATQAQ